MKKVIKLTESDLHKIIESSVNRILKTYIKEDISTKHNGHNYDDYLDDNDFIELSKRAFVKFNDCQVSLEDFTEPEFRERLIDEVEDMVKDFVFDEAGDFFGYKYGTLHGSGYRNVAEHIIDYLETKFTEANV